MAMTDIKTKIANLFPAPEDVPADAEVMPGGKPYLGGLDYLVDGQVKRWSGASTDVLSPVCVRQGGKTRRKVIGPCAMLTKEEALAALSAAVRAWDKGCGPWPRMKIQERLRRLELFAARMAAQREPCVRLLMWEIGKSRADSEKEFDRTIEYLHDTVRSVKNGDRNASRFLAHSGILAQIRRAPLGVVLSLGPFNYPLNESFATLIPALIMGNPVVAKGPRFGMLCMAPLLPAFAECFPPGVVNILNGDGAVVAGSIVETGAIAALAFIGSTKVANILKKQHPRPNRMRCVLGMGAKNPGIILKDADLDLTVAQCVTGALSFNGQRCTALKLIFVHRSLADRFVEKLSAEVDKLPFGMPWEKGVQLTPLPEPGKAEFLKGWVDEACKKGASIANTYGGLANETFYFPAVVYPTPKGTALYEQEQFGPLVPVTPFDDVQEIEDWIVASDFGQQASIFGQDPRVVGPLIDVLANQICRINLNAQCQRGPDVYPFTGRKDSAESTLSVSDALRCFSVRSMVAVPENPANKELLHGIMLERTSNFLNTDYIF